MCIVFFKSYIFDHNCPDYYNTSARRSCDATVSGGAIYSQGNLSLIRSYLTSCTAGLRGGAVYASGPSLIRECHFHDTFVRIHEEETLYTMVKMLPYHLEC